jgi:hypothetical protein
MDYLRVGALALLIVYHVLLVFDAADGWRIRSEHAGLWAHYVTSSLTSWRMPLVFFVGGVAARFMFETMSTGQFVRDRAFKLLTAFVFAVIVLVPLQGYVRLGDVGEPPQTYLHYLLNGALSAMSFHGLPIPDFAHAWFLPYLFVYSVAVVLLWRTAPRLCAWMQRIAERAPLWALTLALMVWLAFVESVVAPWRQETRLLFPDIKAHVHFAPLFLLGVLLAKSEVFREKLLAGRVYLSVAALTLLAVSLMLRSNLLEHATSNELAQFAALAARGVFGGVMLLAVTSIAAWALNKPSVALTYATDAILPVYLMHQTVLIVVGDAILMRHWPLALELITLTASTILIPLALYHVFVRPTAWLRMLFGLRPKPRTSKPANASATPQPASAQP